jgi:hypothetical protein
MYNINYTFLYIYTHDHSFDGLTYFKICELDHCFQYDRYILIILIFILYCIVYFIGVTTSRIMYTTII